MHMQTQYFQNTGGSRIEFIEIELNALVNSKKITTEIATHIISQFHNSSPGSSEREIAEFNFSNAIRYS